ncbi:hypothetical protein K502DRAFT_345505 [Neoconidiobolus thromboides FSU 785]|nr:hypothetical protein K502DRAFT_345505 [Neoconidiobolus thromboides FSU 785]
MVDSYNFNHSLRKEYNFYITSKNQTFISRSQNNLYFFYQCLIQANHPIELDSKLNYFEIKIIKNDNANLPFYIGLGTKADYLIDLKASAFLQVNKQRILINGKNAYKLNTLLPNNSVIGVLYRPLPKNEVTFTLNGNIISTRKLSIEQNHLLYPTILGSRDIVLNFNFGYNPFLYDYANQSNLGCMHFLSDHELPPNYVVEVQ